MGRNVVDFMANGVAIVVRAIHELPLRRWRAWAKKFLALQIAFSYFLLLCSTSAGAATLKFEYDQAGNMISGQGLYYEYNDANQLVKVRKDAPSGPVIAEYVYDYQGQRVKKIENGITTYYIGKHYEERKGNTVNEKTNYIFVNGQRVAASIKKDNGLAKVSYYLNNHLGSADVVVDAQGNVTDKVRYYPYGEYRTQPNAQRHTYTGKERDEATEQYYYEARYYNPFIRRFAQADTVTPNLYDPQSLNRYAYTRNNPVKYVDPSGHLFDVVFDVIFIANDIKTLVTDPSSRTAVNYLALGADVAGLLIPGATGLGTGVKVALTGAAVVDNVADTVRAIDKTGDVLSSTKKGFNPFRNTDNAGNAIKSVGKNIDKADNVDNVIKETFSLKKPDLSKYTVTSDEALDAGEKFLGAGYKEIGKPGSGVFLSADGTRQFRIDENSLTGKHSPGAPHFHLELKKQGSNKPYANNHILYVD
ncbi:RHS repeat domain-containing protein [Candidatus Electronema sp. JC]|uniref:RHS repeat domain-containing protein n=1 Tax=Candidatus Electronema sp. JC TaxID=3401570 RepID=UPI003B4388ED